MQNLQLLLHIPDLPTLDAQTAVSWQLFDRQADLLRDSDGALTTLSNVPRAERTVIVIPARRVVYIETLLPPVSAVKRDALLRYAIEDKLTIDPATVHAVVLGVAASNDPNTHVVAAIDRAWLASVLRWLGDAAIVPAQAISAAELIPVARGEWGLVLDGSHGLARRADGFAYSFDVDNAAAQNSGFPDEPPFALTLALKEARDHQQSPSQLTVFTNQTSAAPWIAGWQRALDCQVRVAARPNARMVSRGAGNLLAGDFAPPSTHGAWAKTLRPALQLIALIAFVQITFIVIDAWRLDQRRRALEHEMTQVFKEAFPKAQAIVDPPLQMQRNLDTMKRERGIGAGDDARLALAHLAAILRDTPSIVPQRVLVRDGTVSLETTVADAGTQAKLKSRVAETPGAMFNVEPGNVVRLSVKGQP
ncbi:MAG: type II secretion system protein GspL [Burkholderiales bacterium]|nr:type II secretion system protein GspL [Burkholderiales bacterium]